ncbi:biotin--[acetyl-CoA-carboxylase] ligase [Cutibacterium sp.]|uniref:biotin--[acetyl-CoA-carboxylase] ligase n=1 Tax=Cutibacterium sp. TaxID=1912221 RepID=UPI0026DDC2B6|nr:biotin--[acetyl-CoA-carboxylase] ligase [Cutibacterium sp.]MDO4413326.1 biotin--[acetyl-CoA-carboxylase] ligase [Cutibacterium sp.]
MPSTPAPVVEHVVELAGNTMFTGPRGAGVTYVESTGSTNADMAAFVRSGGTSFRVLIAGHQDGGRGRFARRWQDTPGTNLAVSVLVPNNRPGRDWGWLSMVAGLAVAKVIEEVGGADRSRVTLKWPNDVLVDLGTDHGGKVCGILSERVDGPAGPHAVIGIGINVSMGVDELPVPTATSLALCGLSHDKDELLASLLVHLDDLLTVWLETGTVRDQYVERCDTIGAPVRITFDTEVVGGGDAAVEGVGVDVDDDGAIVVENSEGRRSFYAGDVNHLRIR